MKSASLVGVLPSNSYQRQVVPSQDQESIILEVPTPQANTNYNVYVTPIIGGVKADTFLSKSIN